MQFINLEPPQLPQAAPSTIAPASPSVASFNLSTLPEQARSQVGTISEEFISASSRAAKLSQEEIYKIFGNMPSNDIDEIIEISNQVDEKHSSDIVKGANLSGKFSIYRSKFKPLYKGKVGPETAASKAWEYYKQVNQLYSR
jgi:hypothetical protein